MTAKLWAVVKREYVERVRTKGFVIGTILGPLLMGGMMIVPALAARSGSKPLRVAVLDATGTLRAPVEEALRAARFDGKARFEVRPRQRPEPARPPGRPRRRGRAQEGRARRPARRLPPACRPTRSPRARRATTAATSATASTCGRWSGRSSDVLVGRRLTGAGLDPAKVKDLTRELDLKTIRLSETGEREDQGAAMIFSIILLMILYMSILLWGQAVMTSVIEEKTSRVVEVMAAGVSPTTLLAGKLLGVGAAGLTQFLVWALSLFGVSVFGAGIAMGAVRDARDHAGDARLLRALLPARLPVLRRALRGDRGGGEHRRRRPRASPSPSCCRSSSPW